MRALNHDGMRPCGQGHCDGTRVKHRACDTRALPRGQTTTRADDHADSRTCRQAPLTPRDTHAFESLTAGPRLNIRHPTPHTSTRMVQSVRRRSQGARLGAIRRGPNTLWWSCE
eukprot:316013-Chlamydomonas_euryale.AAC.1